MRCMGGLYGCGALGSSWRVVEPAPPRSWAEALLWQDYQRRQLSLRACAGMRPPGLVLISTCLAEAVRSVLPGTELRPWSHAGWASGACDAPQFRVGLGSVSLGSGDPRGLAYRAPWHPAPAQAWGRGSCAVPKTLQGLHALHPPSAAGARLGAGFGPCRDGCELTPWVMER